MILLIILQNKLKELQITKVNEDLKDVCGL